MEVVAEATVLWASHPWSVAANGGCGADWKRGAACGGAVQRKVAVHGQRCVEVQWWLGSGPNACMESHGGGAVEAA